MSPYPSFTQQILLLQGQHSWMTLHLHWSYHPVHHSSFFAEVYTWLLGDRFHSSIFDHKSFVAGIQSITYSLLGSWSCRTILCWATSIVIRSFSSCWFPPHFRHFEFKDKSANLYFDPITYVAKKMYCSASSLENASLWLSVSHHWQSQQKQSIQIPSFGSFWLTGLFSTICLLLHLEVQTIASVLL